MAALTIQMPQSAQQHTTQPQSNNSWFCCCSKYFKHWSQKVIVVLGTGTGAVPLIIGLTSGNYLAVAASVGTVAVSVIGSIGIGCFVTEKSVEDSMTAMVRVDDAQMKQIADIQSRNKELEEQIVKLEKQRKAQAEQDKHILENIKPFQEKIEKLTAEITELTAKITELQAEYGQLEKILNEVGETVEESQQALDKKLEQNEDMREKRHNFVLARAKSIKVRVLPRLKAVQKLDETQMKKLGISVNKLDDSDDKFLFAVKESVEVQKQIQSEREKLEKLNEERNLQIAQLNILVGKLEKAQEYATNLQKVFANAQSRTQLITEKLSKLNCTCHAQAEMPGILKKINDEFFSQYNLLGTHIQSLPQKK